MTTGVVLPIGFDKLESLAVLSKGREPIIAPQFGGFVHAPNLPPANKSTAGADIFSPSNGALVTYVGVRLRESPSSFRSLLRVDDIGAGNYGLSFAYATSTFSVPVAAGATPADTVADIKAALDVDAAFLALSGTTTINETNDNTLEVRTTIPAHRRIGGATGIVGPTQQSLASEAQFCQWRLWGLRRGRNDGQNPDVREWCVIGPSIRTTRAALTLEPEFTAGFDRLYVEILRADGFVLPLIGPCHREDVAIELRDDAATKYADAEAALLNFAATSTGNVFMSEVRKQAVESIDTTSSVVFFANPYRRGFFLRNQGGGPISLVWVDGSTDTATLDQLTIEAGEVYALSGDGVIKGALVAVSGNAAGEDLFVLEW